PRPVALHKKNESPPPGRSNSPLCTGRTDHSRIEKQRQKHNRKKAYLMTLAKKLEENKLTIIGTAALLLVLWAGYQSGIFSSQESMVQFLRRTGALAPLCFLFLQTIQVVIPVVPGGVSCIIGVAIFSPVNGFFLNYVGMVTGSVISFLLAMHYGQGFLL